MLFPAGKELLFRYCPKGSAQRSKERIFTQYFEEPSMWNVHWDLCRTLLEHGNILQINWWLLSCRLRTSLLVFTKYWLLLVSRSRLMQPNRVHMKTRLKSLQAIGINISTLKALEAKTIRRYSTFRKIYKSIWSNWAIVSSKCLHYWRWTSIWMHFII